MEEAAAQKWRIVNNCGGGLEQLGGIMTLGKGVDFVLDRVNIKVQATL